MRKHYLGDIPFDHFGNQKAGGYPSKLNLVAESIIGTQLWLNKFDPVLRKQVLCLSIFNIYEAGVEFLDTPPHPALPNVIATVPSCILLPNFFFVDTLEYTGYSAGRSSAYMNFKSTSTYRTYHCFLSDFDDFIKVMREGVIHSTRFTFCKKGSSFGLVVAN